MKTFAFAIPSLLQYSKNSYPTIKTSLQSVIDSDSICDDECSSTRRNVIPKIITSTSSSIFIISSLIVQPKKSFALQSTEAEKSYDKYAKNYDNLDGGSVADTLGIGEARNRLISTARGKVLEIAVGTGLNLANYKFASSQSAMDGVTSLTLLDISDGMLSEAKAKIDNLNVPSFVDIKFIKADATSDDVTGMFGEDSFDTIIDTFSLCVMGNDGAQNCLIQMHNLVKKEVEGGRILLIENSRSSNSLIGWYQDVTAEAAASLGGKGCVSNQDVESIIQNVDGLKIQRQEQFASGLFRSFVCTKS